MIVCLLPCVDLCAICFVHRKSLSCELYITASNDEMEQPAHLASCSQFGARLASYTGPQVFAHPLLARESSLSCRTARSAFRNWVLEFRVTEHVLHLIQAHKSVLMHLLHKNQACRTKSHFSHCRKEFGSRTLKNNVLPCPESLCKNRDWA